MIPRWASRERRAWNGVLIPSSASTETRNVRPLTQYASTPPTMTVGPSATIMPPRPGLASVATPSEVELSAWAAGIWRRVTTRGSAAIWQML